MGTLSLIFGPIGIGIGSTFGVFAYVFTYLESSVDTTSHFLISAGISIIGIGGGSALIVKNYNEKKKEKKS